MFRGSIVAIVTPFKKGKLDEETLEKLVAWHLKEGTSGIVPCGTTGESPTLSYEEHERVIEIVVKAAKGRVPVIAGTGSNATDEAIYFTKHAEKVGADAALVVSPYYNKPTQRGLFAHFKAIADSTKLPIILYNIASRTAVNIEPDTMLELSKIKNIVGVKEASGSLDQMSRIHQICGQEFDLISGDDALTLPLLSIGGKGIISVVANIVPGDVAKMVTAFEAGDLITTREYHYKLFSLVKAMFIETNPVPVKAAMAMMGLCGSELRLPLVDISDVNKKKLAAAMKDYGIDVKH